MRPKKTTILILSFLTPALFSGYACAQSMFGLNFIGEHRFRGSARHRALGLSAVALPDSAGALTMNTASTADLTRVTFSVYEALGMHGIRSEEENVEQNRFQLPAVMVAVPLGKGFVCSVGYRTRFEGKGDFSLPGSLTDGQAPHVYYKRRSTLFTAPIALAWKAAGRFNIAGELQVERGSIVDDVSVDFEETGYGSADSKRSRHYSGTSWAVSMLLRVHSRVYLGAFLDDRVSYSVKEDFSYSREEFDSSASWEFELPPAYGVGAAVGLTERWWLTSSFWLRESPVPVGFRQFEGSLADEMLLAFGAERGRGETGGFFSRIPLRIGFYENRWHLEFPAGEQVKARFLTLGTGFRLPGGPGNVDLSVEFGQIGSIENNGLDERMIKVGVGINVSETWSRRRERRP